MADAISNSLLNESLGSIMDFSSEGQSIDIRSSNAQVRIGILTDEIIQIKIIPEACAEMKHSYAVVLDAEECAVEIKESDDKFSISTASLSLEVTKNPMRFTLKNSEGKILNEDDPAFGCSWISSEICTYKKLQEGERFIGLGEKVGPLDKKGRAFTNWNTDAFAYGPETDPLYASTPFYIGIHGALCYGIFLDNPAKSHFNFGASNDRFSSFTVDAGEMNYFYVGGPNPLEIVKNYSKLTGAMPLPPKWSLGLQQCRYSYYPEHEVRQIARSYREKKIPCDVIYYDIHYMDAYKVFTWDKEKFPDPEKLNADLLADGFSTVAIMDPGVKIEEGYLPYEEGNKNNLFLQYPDGENYTADVWPGSCHFPDFTNDEARKWWSSKVPELKATGIRGYWNDMNEPACWGQDIPHLIEFDNKGDKRSHKQMRNVYGMEMARSTYEGSLIANKAERPFVLSRAAYSGIQRYAALWTGDNVANDEHMLLGVRLINNLGLAGVPYSGYDVGGFCGETSPELFARWFSIGALSPFFRCHKMINSADSEPWSYGERVEEISRNYANLRYRLMSYIYALFYEASTALIPIQRSLALEYYEDPHVFEVDFENQYLFGPSIMVCPMASTVSLGKVYLPDTDWYYLYNDKKYAAGVHLVECPIEALPLFAKAGSMFTENSLIQHTNEKTDDELILHVYKAEAGRFSFTHYEDDGISFSYKEGQFFKCEISYDADNNFIDIAENSGNSMSNYSSLKIYLHGWEIENEPENTSHRFIEPISSFDPFMNEKNYELEIKKIAYRIVELTGKSMRIDL